MDSKSAVLIAGAGIVIGLISAVTLNGGRAGLGVLTGAIGFVVASLVFN